MARSRSKDSLERLTVNHENRIVPERGIDVPEEKRHELAERVGKLQTTVDSLSDQALLPDVVIFLNAVRYALDQDIFYDEKDVANAFELLDEGETRATQLASGNAPWTEHTGLVVRGYRSDLDDSVQPYGLVVPESYVSGAGRKHRLDIWHHGRNAKGSELRFLVERRSDPGRFTPEDTFVLHTYGRYCNAMKFAGEVDTFEALAHAKSEYRVDADCVCMRGFSMGGAATWHLATHYPGEWVAATPGAGFAETAIYQNLAARDIQPPWWEQKMWGMYDATKVAGNLRHCPTIAYSGENDKQMQASDIMSEAMEAEGLELPHIIGPGMGHEYDDGSKDEIERRLLPIVARGRELAPAEVRFTTYTLKYNRMRWVRVDRLVEHWVRSQVNAKATGNGFEVETDGVASLTLTFESGQCPVTGKPEVSIDGDRIEVEPVNDNRSWSASFECRQGRWGIAGPQTGCQKAPGLQGPIDDAFMSRFLMVSPTGTPMTSERVSRWIEREREDATYQWKMQFRGDALCKADTEVSRDDMHGHNLILWGDPSSNAVISQVIGGLPLTWDQQSVALSGESFGSDGAVPVLIYPNPLSPNRYVVLNSGFTFAPNGSMSNATQTPKLPDWAILDVDIPAASRPSEGVFACGFFDEWWNAQC